jgi:hypothetical protein
MSRNDQAAEAEQRARAALEEAERLREKLTMAESMVAELEAREPVEAADSGEVETMRCALSSLAGAALIRRIVQSRAGRCSAALAAGAGKPAGLPVDAAVR